MYAVPLRKWASACAAYGEQMDPAGSGESESEGVIMTAREKNTRQRRVLAARMQRIELN